MNIPQSNTIISKNIQETRTTRKPSRSECMRPPRFENSKLRKINIGLFFNPHNPASLVFPLKPINSKPSFSLLSKRGVILELFENNIARDVPSQWASFAANISPRKIPRYEDCRSNWHFFVSSFSLPFIFQYDTLLHYSTTCKSLGKQVSLLHLLSYFRKHFSWSLRLDALAISPQTKNNRATSVKPLSLNF